ncbi:MAG: hypothetical protein EPN20_13950, partial [Magnetospirillum sp.]
MVAWDRWILDVDVLFQRYDADGHAVGPVTQVNTYVDAQQYQPRITVLGDGGWVVAWTSYGPDGSGYALMARRYDVTGTAMGGEFRVNSTVASHQMEATITSLADGGFVIGWAHQLSSGSSDYDIYTQRYSANGARVGGEVRINSANGSWERRPSLSSLADGGYVVTWSADQVFVQIFNADGSRRGGEALVSANMPTGAKDSCSIGLTDGGFAIAWEEGETILIRRYDAQGVPVGQQFAVSDANRQVQDAILSARSDGGFAVTWAENANDGAGWMTKTYEFEASNVAPVIEAPGATLGQGATIAAEALVASGHVQGARWDSAGLQQVAMYEFADDTAVAGSGYFTVNGVVQAAGANFVVTADQLSTVHWVAGDALGADQYRVRAFDGVHWSGWASGEVTTVSFSSSLVAHAGPVLPSLAGSSAVLADGSLVVVSAGKGQVYGRDGAPRGA